MKRVLLTGATGFIGRHAVGPLLQRGYEVHVAGRSEPPAWRGRVIFHPANLLDRTSVQTAVSTARPSHLLHLAWYVEPGKFWTSPQNPRWLQASIDLLAAFTENGGKRAMTAGTCAEYDWLGDGICREASSRILPATLYGAAKNCVHEMQDAMMRQSGGQSVWGRIFHVYGPNEAVSRFVPHVITSLLRGEEARCSPGHQIRDFMHAADVARAFVHVLDSDFPGTVNIGTGSTVTLAEVAQIIARELAAESLLRLGSIPQSPGDPERLVPDVSVLTGLGFRPQYSLADGLRDAIRWWKTQTSELSRRS